VYKKIVKLFAKKQKAISVENEELRKAKICLIGIAQDIKNDIVDDLRPNKISFKKSPGGLDQIYYNFKNGDMIYFTHMYKGGILLYKKGKRPVTIQMNVHFAKDFIKLFNEIFEILEKKKII
jgi:hypothetical protein